MGGDGFGDDATDLISIGQRTLGTQSEYSAVYIGLSCGLVDVLCDGSWGAMGAVIARGLNGHMVITDPLISAVVLCLAGAYQFSGYKLNGLT